MKRFLKWTLIATGIIVGVAVLDDFANVFLVRDSLGYAVIDCGD